MVDSMAQSIDRKYVKAEPPKALSEALDAQFRGPLFMARTTLAGLVFIAVLIGLIAPFVNPLREKIGAYLYVHILIVVTVLFWFFTRVVPPPSKGSESRRRRFLQRLKDRRLQRAGLDPTGISTVRIAADEQTLEIVVRDEWLEQPPEARFRDIQNFWWLWSTVYLPYEGFEKVFVRVLDSKGNEVGGSRSDAGSLIWAR